MKPTVSPHITRDQEEIDLLELALDLGERGPERGQQAQAMLIHSSHAAESKPSYSAVSVPSSDCDSRSDCLGQPMSNLLTFGDRFLGKQRGGGGCMLP